MSSREEIAQRMCEAIDNYGLPRSRFCKKLPMTYQSLFELLKGSRDISLSTIIVTADITGYREEWIRYGEEPKLKNKISDNFFNQQSKEFLDIISKESQERKEGIKNLINAINQVNND